MPDTVPPTADEQRLAETVGAVMYARDRAAQALGITLEEIGPGYAIMRMTVRDDMLNGHDICHGGMTFALADTAFPYACNARNTLAVARGCSITFTAPAHASEMLTAVAREQVLHGRSGVNDIRVTDRKDRVIATFRGNAHLTRQTVIGDREPGGLP